MKRGFRRFFRRLNDRREFSCARSVADTQQNPTKKQLFIVGYVAEQVVDAVEFAFLICENMHT